MLLLPNAYVDIGTWHGVTPYVGAGIGGAWVKWDTLTIPISTVNSNTMAARGWRFAYASWPRLLLPDRRVKLDVGYRYSHINGGRMFDYASTACRPRLRPWLNVHGSARWPALPVRPVGLRPPPEPYVPSRRPIYTK